MFVRVKMMDTGVWVTIRTSRTTVIEDFKKMVKEKFNVEPTNQRLFFAGKQLENQYRLFDYGINVNDVIQLMVRATENSPHKKSLSKVAKDLETAIPISSSSSATTSSASDEDDSEETFEESKYFKVGDYVDIKDLRYGAWFMSKLIKIKKDNIIENESNDPKNPVENDGLIYVVEILRSSEESHFKVKLQDLRPIASELLPLSELKCGEKILANYNAEYPKERGYWYDALIKEIKPSKKGKFDVIADVCIGMDNAVLRNCNLMFLDNLYKIKPNKLLASRTPEDNTIMETEPAAFRFGPLYCIKCKDNMDKSCKHCGCRVCGGKDNEDKQLMCDECNHPYHMVCLTPPLKEMPGDDDWYCPSCKNDENEIVKAGGKLKASKKKDT